MQTNRHTKNTIKYYLILFFALFFLFFSGDLGSIDVQKTAIVMAVGIDRTENEFVVTSQIAIPKDSKQGKSSQTVQIVSTGKTVADALDEINAKTGWYPKLVFCRLIILGETAVAKNAFDSLEFFLLDEYLSDNCLIATCDGSAKDLLNQTALVDDSGSVAMQKVLSPHAERVGSALPSTLREFAIGYFSDSKSGYLPILTTKPQQEPPQNSQGGQNGQSGGQAQGGQGGSSGQSQGEQSGGAQENKPVFSASETALFKNGKRVGKLTKEETFAFTAVEKQLKLAGYSVQADEGYCTLNIKSNRKKKKLTLNGDIPVVELRLVLTAGVTDATIGANADNVSDGGDIPSGAFSTAEQLLSAQITSVFEKCKALKCDLFGVNESIQKYHQKAYKKLKNTAQETALLQLSVVFERVR